MDLLHIRHAIFLIRQSSDIPIRRLTLPLLHKDQIQPFEIAIFLLIHTLLDFFRGPLDPQLLPIKISLILISTYLLNEVDGSDVEDMCDFILFEGGSGVLFLGVHVLVVKLVLCAVEQLERLSAARMNFTLDGTARQPFEAAVVELDVDVLGEDLVKLELRGEVLGVGCVVTVGCCLRLDVIIILAEVSLVCHSSIVDLLSSFRKDVDFLKGGCQTKIEGKVDVIMIECIKERRNF